MALTKVSRAISEYIAQNTIIGRFSSGSGKPETLTLSENFTTSGGVFASNGLMRILQGTPVATTAGTAIDFTGIPSWAKEITIMFNGVSTNGASSVLVQIGGSGGIENTGYVSMGSAIQGNGVAATSYNTGFGIANNDSGAAAHIRYGQVIITKVNSTNLYVYSAMFGVSGATEARTEFGGGNKLLSTTLDRIRITSVNGTDVFDAGSVNILVKG